MSRTDERGLIAQAPEGASPPVCPACGAAARRALARFCATCGRSLRGEREYRPADGLRASYRWHRPADTLRRPRETASRVGAAGLSSGFRLSAAARLRARTADDSRARVRRVESSSARRVESSRARRNSQTARAYVLLAYALALPCVGILLCPPALACGVGGLRRARRERAGRAVVRESERAVVYAVALSAAQALLWLVTFGLVGLLS